MAWKTKEAQRAYAKVYYLRNRESLLRKNKLAREKWSLERKEREKKRVREAWKKYQLQNPERSKVRFKVFRIKHREKILKRNRAAYKADPQRYRGYVKKWALKHRDAVLSRTQRWKEINVEHLAEYDRVRHQKRSKREGYAEYARRKTREHAFGFPLSDETHRTYELCYQIKRKVKENEQRNTECPR